MGDCRVVDPFSSDLQLPSSLGPVPRVWRFANQGAGRTITLPDATLLPLGGPHFVLSNSGAESIAVEDFDGNSVLGVAMETSRAFICYLAENGTTAGVWVVVRGYSL